MSSDIDQLVSDGWDKYFEEKYIQAKVFFRKALMLEPGHIDSLRGLALSHLECGDLKDAELTIRSAIGIEASNAELWHDLGNILEEQGDQDGARFAYIRATEIEPKNSDYLISWGHLELSRNEFEAAEFAMREAVRHHPNDPHNWQQLAIVFQMQNRNHEAQESMDEADRLLETL